MSQAMTIVGDKPTERYDFSPAQEAMIYDAFANGASRKEFEVLLEIARARRLNPLLKQIHFVKRWNGALKRETWACQASIDGLRAIAERTGRYDGQDEPECIYDEAGKLVACKVRVYRKDWSRPAVGVAHYEEYVQRTKEGAPTQFWRNMPHVMLSKCAEAIALRKAFPEDMAGLYTADEMMQAERPARIDYDQETGEVTSLERQLSDSLHESAPQDVVVDTAAFTAHMTALLDARTAKELTQAMARVAHDKAKLTGEQVAQLRKVAADQKQAVGG